MESAILPLKEVLRHNRLFQRDDLRLQRAPGPGIATFSANLYPPMRPGASTHVSVSDAMNNLIVLHHAPAEKVVMPA